MFRASHLSTWKLWPSLQAAALVALFWPAPICVAQQQAPQELNGATESKWRLRDSATHTLNNLPIVLAGRGGGTLSPGRHLVYPEGTPLCNLWLSLLTRMGCQLDRFSDSTGPLANLA